MTYLRPIVLGHFKIAACDEMAIRWRVVKAKKNADFSFESMAYQKYHHG
jgi:hypothetical protein